MDIGGLLRLVRAPPLDHALVVSVQHLDEKLYRSVTECAEPRRIARLGTSCCMSGRPPATIALLAPPGLRGSGLQPLDNRDKERQKRRRVRRLAGLGYAVEFVPFTGHVSP